MTAIAYDPDNIFAKIIKGDIPSYRLFETEHVLAILDAFPVAPGHALLLPKAIGFATVLDMTPEVAANVYKELPRLAKAVQKSTGCDGISIIQNNGAASGQVVFHAHIHVLPRFNDDGLMKPPVGRAMITKEDGIVMQIKIQNQLESI